MNKLGKVWLYLIIFLAFVSGGLIIYFYGYDYGLNAADDNSTADSIEQYLNQSDAEGVWRHGITWVEIPVEDIERAKTFYEDLLDTDLEIMRDTLQNNEMVFLPPFGEGIITGSLIRSEDFIPSREGVLIFFNCNPDLSSYLKRAQNAGSKIIQPKVMINEEIGYMAIITDSEGNKIALHSAN